MIGVIVPARDEAQSIARCVASIMTAASHLDLDGEQVVVIVVADHCQDQTADIARRCGAQVLQAPSPGGVGVARATGAQHALQAGARWLATTDADTCVPPDWLARQLATGAEVVCGTVEVEDWSGYPPEMAQAFMQHEQGVRAHRHVHGANMGICARRYVLSGGFGTLACGEDVALVEAAVRSGARVAWPVDLVVTTSSRKQARAPGGFSSFLIALESRLSDVLVAPVAGEPDHDRVASVP
ncbi:glycosyltransferase [Pseudoxanthomonas sp. JBR18]|uniref:glycosyltransferase n=1 Tax=Pseudoxanthomonas sp. JBR18 TaxID=2969308 RepID=UPI0023057E8C|nr:glycosyltransferase [Pseudoxanthomonas sp. JBR18]WCE03873.1 glycosyltransferase [Pseudoxanthomonas sp. JBR18]